MSKRPKKSNAKQNLVNYLINTGRIPPDVEFNIETEINPFEKMNQELALHSDDAKEVIERLSKLYLDSETVKKFREQFKEDFNKDQLNEILENSNKTLNVFEGLIEELKRFNSNFELIREFNENCQKLTEQKDKKEPIIDKEIFKIDIPKDFWSDILTEEEIVDDDY